MYTVCLVERDTFNPRSDGYVIRFKLGMGTGSINRYWTDWDTIEPHWTPDGSRLLLIVTSIEGAPKIYMVVTSEYPHLEVSNLSNLFAILNSLCQDQADFPAGWDNICFTFHSWQEVCETVEFCYETDQGQIGMITYHSPTGIISVVK